MIDLVEVTNGQGSVLGLPLYDVSNGYVLEEVEGLDPVKATIVSSGFAQLDGTQFQSARRDERNIKMKIGLEADFIDTTVASLRRDLYQYFMPKSYVALRLYDDDDTPYDIVGRVEDCAAPLFTDEPMMDISIICFDPDFLSPDEVSISGSTVSDGTITEIDYQGTVETGIEFILNVDRNLSAFTIYNTAPDGTLYQLDFTATGTMVAGDILTISTVPGAKGATLTHSGADGSALYGISPQSSWIELQPGINSLRVYAAGAAVPFTINYTTRYGGL